MAKVKYTKGELKRQRDALRQFERYLPVLQLKKQQLQFEIQRLHRSLDLITQDIDNLEDEIGEWAGLLREPGNYVSQWIKPKEVIEKILNIAGVDMPAIEEIRYPEPEYDLFSVPLWVDMAIERIRELVSLLEGSKMLKRQLNILRDELRITTQRVNLFEKVKIPESRENIRRIKIYLGDQETNAVGRAKIAKRKIQKVVEEIGI